MGHYSEKRLPGFCVYYFHDFHHCLKCKAAMESNIQIGRPLKFLFKKKKVRSDIKSRQFFEKTKHINEPMYEIPELLKRVEPFEKILLRKKVRKMFLSPIKTLLDIPREKMLRKKNSNKIHPKREGKFQLDVKKKSSKSAQKLSKSTKRSMLENSKSNSIKKSSCKSDKKMKLAMLENSKSNSIKKSSCKSDKKIKPAMLENRKSNSIKKSPCKSDKKRKPAMLENRKSNSIKKSPCKSDKKMKPAMLENSKSNFIKKSPCKSDKKKKGSKIPGKGTLKRKKWIHDQFNQDDDNYEDDVYEEKKFEHFQKLLWDDSDSTEKYENLKTPDLPFCLSPRATTPSPTFKDCYNPAQLKKIRKGAVEYQYRRKQRMKASNSKKEAVTPKVEQQPIAESYVRDTLNEVLKILSFEKTKNESVSDKTSDMEEDQYFCDLLDSTNTVDRT